MALEIEHQLNLMHAIYIALSEIKKDRQKTYTKLLQEKRKAAVHVPDDRRQLVPTFTHVQQALTCVREMDRTIWVYDQMIEELRNPPVPDKVLTDQDRFDKVMGIAVAYKLDIPKLVQESRP